MATMKSRISSSSFTYEYDVFISFRGVDTRSGFTSNLYKALCEKGVKAFMDDQDIKPGEEINQALDKAIQKSRIALVIFSQNYASSTFCLEELAKIVECSKDKGMLVMPVFYQVDPAEVRHHRKGSYAKALAKHETRNEKEKIETWRVAMKKVANIYGWHIKDDRPEDEFIDKIFKSISKEISSLGDGDKKKIFSNVGDKYVAQHNKVNCYKAQGLVTKELEIGIPTENREREFITQKEREMGRAPCCDKANVKKCPWSPAEDSKLKWHIMMHGTEGNWITLPQRAGLKRSGESCRLRWLNYLRPGIKRGEFSDEEDRIICSLYASIGSRWSIIAAQLPGRTDNDIKNYWNTKLKKKLMFGSEESCSSSDGSCSQVSHNGREIIKQEEMAFQNYMLSGFEEYNNNNTFRLSTNNGSECINQWDEKPNGYSFFETQTTMDYELEDIKQLISSNNGYLNIDENKGTTECN